MVDVSVTETSFELYGKLKLIVSGSLFRLATKVGAACLLNSATVRLPTNSLPNGPIALQKPAWAHL